MGRQFSNYRNEHEAPDECNAINWLITCKPPASDVDGTAVEYHPGSGVSPGHAVYEPDDVDGNEYGQ